MKLLVSMGEMLGTVMGLVSLGPDVLRSDISQGDSSGLNCKLDVAFVTYGKTQSIFQVIRESLGDIILHEARTFISLQPL